MEAGVVPVGKTNRNLIKRGRFQRNCARSENRVFLEVKVGRGHPVRGTGAQTEESSHGGRGRPRWQNDPKPNQTGAFSKEGGPLLESRFFVVPCAAPGITEAACVQQPNYARAVIGSRHRDIGYATSDIRYRALGDQVSDIRYPMSGLRCPSSELGCLAAHISHL